MARRKKKEKVSFVEKLRKIKKAGLMDSPPADRGNSNNIDSLDKLNKRIENILGIYRNKNRNPNNMIYFIMYDIENDKIRTQISKYLIKKSCVRIQKSIFIADTKRDVYNEISNTLKEVQDVYDNSDSIILVPVSTDQLRSMKLIGENIDFDMVLHQKNTMFF